MSDVELSIDLQLKVAQMKLDAFGKTLNEVADKGKAVGAANKKAAKDSEKAFSSMVKGLGAVAGAWLGVSGAQKAYQMALQSAKASDTIAIFESTGESIETLRKATRGLISDATLAKNANLARTMGINSDQFAKLANIANAAAKSTGESSEFMLESIVKGTARSSKLLLDNLGILVSVGTANEAHARKLGISVEAMSDFDKKQAFINATLDAGVPLMESAALAGANNAEAYDQFAAGAENLAMAFGHALRPAVEYLIPALKEVADLLDRISNKQKPGALQKETLKANIESMQRAAEAQADIFNPVDPSTGRRGSMIRLEPYADVEKRTAEKKYKYLQKKITELKAHWANEEIKAQEKVKKAAEAGAGSKRRGGRGGSNGAAEAAWYRAQYGGAGDSKNFLGGQGGSFGGLDPFLAAELRNEELAAQETQFKSIGDYGKGGGAFAGLDPYIQLDQEKRKMDKELAEQRKKDAAALAADEIKKAREVAKEKEQLQADITANAQIGIGIGVDLMQSATEMIINQEKHILERLTAMGLARVGQEFVAKGSLLAAEGLGLAIMSHGADPAGYAAMAQGGAMIGTGMAMGAGGMLINKAIGSSSGGGDSVSAGAISNRGNGAQTIGASNQTQIVVNYGVNGPHPDETARAVKDALNLANRRAMR